MDQKLAAEIDQRIKLQIGSLIVANIQLHARIEALEAEKAVLDRKEKDAAAG